LLLAAFDVKVSECNTAPGMPESTLQLPHKLARVMAVQEEMLSLVFEMDNLAGKPLSFFRSTKLQVLIFAGCSP
jgi:hypothetical protein